MQLLNIIFKTKYIINIFSIKFRNLSGNQLVRLNSNNFAVFKKLQKLILNQNHLESIIKDSFNGLFQLTSL